MLQNLYYSTNFGPPGLFSPGYPCNNESENGGNLAQEMVKNILEQS